MKLFEIKRNTSGRVRTTLCIEDIKFIDKDVALGFELVQIVKAQAFDEEVYIFREPYRVPKFNTFYASRIKSIADPYLIEAVRRLLYLNPLPDPLMIKKITEYIVLHFSAQEIVDSSVTHQQISKPVLTFEQVEGVVFQQSVLQKVDPKEDFIPDNDQVVMFKRESKLSKGEKISIRSQYRHKNIEKYLGIAIHGAAEFLMAQYELLKVTNTSLRDTELIRTEKGVASTRTISKYMEDRTRRVLDEHNKDAPFKSQKTDRKFGEFLDLPEMSLNGYALALDVSKSTVVEFKRLKKTLLEQGLLTN